MGQPGRAAAEGWGCHLHAARPHRRHDCHHRHSLHLNYHYTTRGCINVQLAASLHQLLIHQVSIHVILLVEVAHSGLHSRHSTQSRRGRARQQPAETGDSNMPAGGSTAGWDQSGPAHQGPQNQNSPSPTHPPTHPTSHVTPRHPTTSSHPPAAPAFLCVHCSQSCGCPPQPGRARRWPPSSPCRRPAGAGAAGGAGAGQ